MLDVEHVRDTADRLSRLALAPYRPPKSETCCVGGALLAIFRAWRASLTAGFFGATGSGLWFMAVGLFPVGPVRA
ncbi:MAG: hypothetical protein ACRED9_15445, partial [Caulobacteraceae bacterium]